MVEIELLIQRSDQFRSNKIIKGFFLVYLGFTFFVVWVNVFLVKEVKPSRLYFEWVEGGKNNFLKPKFKKLIKYYILLFCFINSRGGHCPPRSSNSSIPGSTEKSAECQLFCSFEISVIFFTIGFNECNFAIPRRV